MYSGNRFAVVFKNDMFPKTELCELEKIVLRTLLLLK